MTEEHVTLEQEDENKTTTLPAIQCDTDGNITYVGGSTLTYPVNKYTVKVDDNRQRWAVVAFASSGSAKHSNRGLMF